LISSHILSELHLLATHYGIIHEGELLEQFSAKELNEKCQHYLHIKVNDTSKAITLAVTGVIFTGDIQQLAIQSVGFTAGSYNPIGVINNKLKVLGSRSLLR